MKLIAEIGFYLPISIEKKGFLKYHSSVEASDSLESNELEKQAHALKMVDTEMRLAIQRVNDRLKSEGLGKFAFHTPKMGDCDEYGNVLSHALTTPNKTDSSSRESFVRIG